MKKDPKRDPILVKHILDAIEQIEEYIHNMDYDSFAKNMLYIDAVVREIGIIGEASTNISDTFRAAHPDIPLYEAIGMRNKIVHEYWEVKIPVVWSTCKHDLPELKKKLLKIV